MDLTQLFSQYTSITNSIRTQLMSDIDAIPDNPNIKRLNNCCFTISSTEIVESGIFCVEYYDFAYQKKILKSVLQTKETLESQLKRLMNIANTGKTVIHSCGQRCTFHFHPDVIKALKEKLAGIEFEV